MSVRIIVILTLLALSAFFSCSETSLFSLSRSEVQNFKSSKSKFAKNVLDLLSKPRHLLVSILLGNELVNVAIAILVAALIYEVIPGVAWQTKVLISVMVSTPLIVVVGEVIPKNVGVRFSPFLAPICALFIRIFSFALAPFRSLLLKLADKVVALSGGNPKDIRSMILEEEFRQMVDLGCDEGTIIEAEGELIHSLFEMADKAVEDVMTPKEGIFSVSLNSDVGQVMALIKSTQFSRIPVYDSDPDDIVGILHIRDLFSIMRRRRVEKIRDVENIVRPAFFAPQSLKLEEILSEFQRLKVHMAIIIDPTRKPVGVVTMEDIFGALSEGR
jgi:CBS domain containing-hemolysin-like protein